MAARLAMSEKSFAPVSRMAAWMGTNTWAKSLTQTCLTCGPIPSGHTNMRINSDDMALTVLPTTPVARRIVDAGRRRGTAEMPVPPSDGETSSAC
jgi:hypothetical protein